MIPNFYELTKDLTNEEREIMWKIYDIIATHLGKDNAINSFNIDNILISQGVNNVKQPRLCKMIKELRVREILPNLCSNSRGYYIANSTEEIIDNCKTFICRTISSMNVALKLLQQGGLTIEDCVDTETADNFYKLINTLDYD